MKRLKISAYTKKSASAHLEKNLSAKVIRLSFLVIALSVFTLIPGNKPIKKKSDNIKTLVADFVLQWKQLRHKKLPDVESPTMIMAFENFSKDPCTPDTPGHRLMDHFIIQQANQAEQ